MPGSVIFRITGLFGGSVAAVSFMHTLMDDLRVWAMLAHYAMHYVCYYAIIVLCMYCACCDRHLLVSYRHPWPTQPKLENRRILNKIDRFWPAFLVYNLLNLPFFNCQSCLL